MTLSWSGRRQLLYYASGAVILLFVLAGVYQTFFKTVPMCNDGMQNGDEHGVDCGGSCALICANEARPMTPLWQARTFRTGPSTFATAIYLQNNNPGAAARKVPYTFQLFDTDNNLINTREGFLDVPPVTLVPIVETNIDVGNLSAAHARFCFESECGTAQPPVWFKVPTNTLPQFTISNKELMPDGTSLSATIVNNSLFDAKNVMAYGVLFDKDGAALAASKSKISVIGAQGSQQIVFTWPLPIEGVVKGEVTVVPSF